MENEMKITRKWMTEAKKWRWHLKLENYGIEFF
jgi:hypothetical protein